MNDSPTHIHARPRAWSRLRRSLNDVPSEHLQKVNDNTKTHPSLTENHQVDDGGIGVF